MRMLELSLRFKLQFKALAKHPEYRREDFEQLLDDLIHLEKLPAHYNEHPLEKRASNYAGDMECHLTGDIVVIYRRMQDVVRLYRIGSHSTVFSPRRRSRPLP
ncbi:type II toxin-antitoxin system YafQ family toxin [Sinimarinibacterium sp. NLF-5-8]|uniref:type II toxin-antitoxin system RelE/ParE family toxin n=1 Tax=Sinimarinibacterium sp. NLF-5-8 TaxID=2698684 RepID=UPI00137BD559|nr:type II toxin-antitoxin system YafQ family toxin [Sinimarinibacterium sp. NLF-5-8]QHS10121.1 type II toxin-antitoxin system YafQ family toxin [Sinimarinibacterium sp. NLF-5-8]